METSHGIAHFETPRTGCHHIIVMIVVRQVIAEQVVEIRIESAMRHFGRIEKFHRAGSRISRIGKQGLAGLGTLCVESVESGPWQQHFTTYFKKIGPAATLKLKRNTFYCAYIVCNDITHLTIAAGNCSDKFAMLVNKRYSGAVEFHLADYCHILSREGFVDAFEPRFDIID